MLFSREALENKKNFLDSILMKPELIASVLVNNIGCESTFTHMKRIWEPGGGSTLFRIVQGDSSYLLKVKHRSVYVESRLESETDYSKVPSLLNEYNFLRELASDGVPEVIFYEERDEFCFLALEWLDTFPCAIKKLTPVEIVKAWESLEEFVKSLYIRGVVHTDIHEGNICFRGTLPVLSDFEEARHLVQEVPFSESLDYKGKNRYGSTGDFPAEAADVKGNTSLDRLRVVLKAHIRNRLPELISECNFDHTCSFNADELQEPDERIYQSLNFRDVRVEGQRPVFDRRSLIVNFLLKRLSSKSDTPATYLDIGCNVGTFCFSASPLVSASIGIDAHARYIDLANVLAFLYDCSNAKFYCLECGNTSLEEVTRHADLVTILSVYHHVSNKQKLLHDIRSLRPNCLLMEMATQERYYPERLNVESEIEYIRNETGFSNIHLIGKSSDYARPLVLFSNEELELKDRWILKMLNSSLARVLKPCF